MKVEKPEIIEGGFFEDLRGRIQYVNEKVNQNRYLYEKVGKSCQHLWNN